MMQRCRCDDGDAKSTVALEVALCDDVDVTMSM